MPTECPPPSATKILFISHEATRTGAPMMLLHLLRWIRRETAQEFEILLVAGGPLKPDFEALAPVHSPAALAALPPSFWRRFRLIYVNSCWSGPVLETLRYGEIPVLTHLHELDCSIDGFGAAKFARLIRRTHHFFACARVVADRLRRGFAIPADRVGVHYEMIAPDGVAANVAGEPAEVLRQRHDLPVNAFVVAGCGTVDARKGPDMFVQAAARVHRQGTDGRPLRFLWIGRTTDVELRRMLDYDIRRLGLQAEVRFVGELAAPHGLLALSDVFCVTSREDPFPLVMLEAAALAKPVVCFEGSGGAAEFCALGGGLTVPFLDVAALADRCQELRLDPARARETGRRGAASVRDHFTVERVAPKLWREIEAVLGRPQSRPIIPAGRDGLTEIFATWLLEEAPERAYLRAHFARQDVRAQARALLAAGRRPDAITLLLRAMRADMETKVPNIVLESLLEIADDLAPLDPAKAGYLLGEARKMAKASGVDLAAVRPPPTPAPAASVACGELAAT